MNDLCWCYIHEVTNDEWLALMLDEVTKDEWLVLMLYEVTKDEWIVLMLYSRRNKALMACIDVIWSNKG